METNLALKKAHYESKVGHRFGYGRGLFVKDVAQIDETHADGAWDAKQFADIEECTTSGLRSFYHCGYAWSFLKPWVTLTLRSGERTVALPDDCGGLEGKILKISDSTSTNWADLPLRSEGPLELLWAANPDATGTPTHVTQRSLKGTGQTKSQQQELFFYPEADDDFSIRLQYYLLPSAWDGTHPYAYGGAEHAETILMSCLAVMEKQFDGVVNGPYAQEFKELLQKSIQMDSRKKPQYMGENRDRSDDMDPDRREMFFSPVTYNGIEYGAD